MSFFLKKTIKFIINNNQNLNNIIFLLPNHKLLSIFKSEFNKTCNIYDYNCNFYTFIDFTQKISNLSLIEDNLLELYIYQILHESNKYKDLFKIFNKSSYQILSDFNDLDMYLIDINNFFKYIISYYEINKWNPIDLDLNKKNIDKKNNISFWEMLSYCYFKLNNILLYNKQGYCGLIYRNAIKYIDQYILNNKNLNKIIFIGMNILSYSELFFIKKIIMLKKGESYWNIDKYYYKDNKKEIGIFFKYNLKTFIQENNIKWIFDEIKKNQNIEIIESEGIISQLKIVNKIINNLKYNNNNNIAIIIPNENINILPLIYLIDKNLKKINLDIPFLLYNSPLSQSYLILFRLFYNRNIINNTGFIVQDIIELLNNIYFKILFQYKEHEIKFIIDKINNNNNKIISYNKIILFINNKILLNIIHPNNDKLPNLVLTIINLYKYFINIIYNIKYNFNIDLIFLKNFDNWIKNIYLIITKYSNIIINIKYLIELYQNWLNKTKKNYIINNKNFNISLLGIIESNLLSFDNIIIIGANEGIFPPEKYNYSFIPFNVRQKFKLPTYKDIDRIYSYYFYHLLQKAKKIFLLYDNRQKGIFSGEKSRYIRQLESSFKILKNQKYNLFVKEHKKYLSYITINKNKSIINKIKDILINQGISPTSINLYIKNPIYFYYQKILNITNKDIQFKNYQFNQIGIIIHKVIELLYYKYINKKLTINIINNIKNYINISIIKIFHNFQITNLNGQNLLNYHIIKEYINMIISWDEKNIQNGHTIILNNIEYYLCYIFNNKIKIYGIIDRIDIFDGKIRIIDYKSSLIKNIYLNIKSNNLQELVNNSAYYQALQLMIYTNLWFYNNKNKNKIIYPGIFSFKNKRQELYNLLIDNNLGICIDNIQNFNLILLYKLQEILDYKYPFIIKDL